MISSKQSLSHVMKRIHKPLATQDCTLIRHFSRTSVLERRINTRKPRPWSYEKQLVLDICKPKYPRNPVLDLPAEKRCQTSTSRLWLMEKKGLTEENPFQKILAKEIFELFEKSKLVAIVHKHSMLAETKFEVRVAFRRLGMEMRDHYGRSTIELAVRDTKYASIMPLFKISEAIIFSPEVKLDALLNTMKKLPQVTLLATIVDGRLLSKTETEFYASTNLATQQALLVQTINSVPTSLTTSLNQHAQTLVGYLDQHAGSAKGSLGPEGSSDAGANEATAAQSESKETLSAEGSSEAAASEVSAAEVKTESASKEAPSTDSKSGPASDTESAEGSSKAASGESKSADASNQAETSGDSTAESTPEAASKETSDAEGSSRAESKEVSSSKSSPKSASGESSDADVKPKSEAGSADSSSTSEGGDKGKSS